MGAQPAVEAQEFKLTWPGLPGYSGLSQEQIDELGNLKEDLLGRTETVTAAMELAVKEGNKKRSPLYPLLPHDADAALAREQWEAVGTFFRQVTRFEVDPEDDPREWAPPVMFDDRLPDIPVDETNGGEDEPPPPPGPTLTLAMDEKEQQSFARRTAQHVWGYRAWVETAIRDCGMDWQPLLDEMRKAARDAGVI